MSDQLRVVFSFKTITPDEMNRQIKGSRILTWINYLSERVAKFASSVKHVEVSVPVDVLRRIGMHELVDQYVVDYNKSRYFTLSVSAYDPETQRGGVSFMPRGFMNKGYTHLSVRRTEQQIRDFVAFAQRVYASDYDYYQRFTDVYLWPGDDQRNGWYCVSLTTAAAQSMGMMLGINQTEMSTGFFMERLLEWYNPQAEMTYVRDTSMRDIIHGEFWMQ